MADVIYNIAKKSFADGNLDWDDNTIVVMLLSSDSTYTPDADHKFVSDVMSNGGVELSGSGYSRKVLTNCVVIQDDSLDRVILDADDVVWTSINAGTATAALIYKRVGNDDSTPNDDILIAYIDSGGFPISTNGGDLFIKWNAEGIINIS